MWKICNTIAEESPACLLGRDLLQTLDVQLQPSPRGTDLIIAGVCAVSEVQDPDLETPKPLEAVPRELWSEPRAGVGFLTRAQDTPQEGAARPLLDSGVLAPAKTTQLISTSPKEPRK